MNRVVEVFFIIIFVMNYLENHFLSEGHFNDHNIVQFFFNIERAYWHYIDVSCSTYRNLLRCDFAQFTSYIFAHIQYLKPYFHKQEELRRQFEM